MKGRTLARINQRVERRVIKAARKAINKKKSMPRRGKGKGNDKNIIVQRVAAPAAYASILKSTGKDRVYRFPGDDFVASVQITAGNVADGDVLFAAPIAPQMFKDSRVAELAKCFAKYRFTKFHLTVGGNLSTNIGGGFIAAVSPDPNIEVVAGPTAKNEIMGWSGSVRSSYYNPVSAVLDVGRSTKWLNTSQSTQTEQSQSLSVQQGIAVVLADGLISGITGSFSLPVSVQYEIEFDEPVSRPQVSTGSTYDFEVTYNPNGAPFKILDAAGSSGLDFVSNYYPSANAFVQTIYNKMQTFSNYVYLVSPPLPGSAYYQTPSGAILSYCWINGGNKIYFTDRLAVAYADGSTYSGAASYFAWPSPNPGTIQTYTFTAIANPLAGVKNGPASIVAPDNDLELLAPESGSTTVYASGDTLQTSDSVWLANLQTAMMDITKGAYSITTNPAPGAWFADGSARNIVVKTGSDITFSNDIADVFSGSPTYAIGTGTVHDWAGLAGGLELKFIEAPLTSLAPGLIDMARAPPNGQQEVEADLHFRIAAMSATHETLTSAINNLASKIAMLEAQM